MNAYNATPTYSLSISQMISEGAYKLVLFVERVIQSR